MKSNTTPGLAQLKFLFPEWTHIELLLHKEDKTVFETSETNCKTGLKSSHYQSVVYIALFDLQIDPQIIQCNFNLE